jgi:SSS family solute:Na+ symporter
VEPGLIAGMMSHVAGALNSAGTVLTVDSYKRFFRRGASDAQMVRFGKIAGIIMLVLATAWAPLIGKAGRLVFMYIQDAYGFFAPGVVAAFFMGLFWKRGNANGSLAAILLTFPLVLTIHLIWHPLFWYRTAITFGICVAVYRGSSCPGGTTLSSGGRWPTSFCCLCISSSSSRVA